MPAYVYAVHDFLPENEDEVNFYAGERIEVIEKDELYGDGWWQGRNLAGDVGLFPVSYTASAPPAINTSHALTSRKPIAEHNNISVLQSLAEESESEAPGHGILSPVPKHPTTFLSNPYDTEEPYENGTSLKRASGDNEMMKATMTDVQKAIEQLGRGGVGEDGDGRSFSFASTIDEANTETSDTDFNLSDLDGTEVNGNEGEDWHKGARRKLAAKAKRAVEEAEKLEELIGENGDGKKVVTPPTEVELSDESDDADFTRTSNFQRSYSHISEEDELSTDGEAAATNGTTIDTLSAEGAPPNDHSDVHTATKPSFSAPQSPLPTESKPAEKSLTPEKSIYPSPISPPVRTGPNAQEVMQKSSGSVREVTNGLPSPASVGHSSKPNSIISSSSAPASQVKQQQPNGTSTLARSASIPVSTQGRNETPPAEWSVEAVVDWLKSRGFDQDICDKFTEQEITGDVLLELDVNLLKSEIGIMAFGKRMRIANAITDLRRPPSADYSDQQLSSMQTRSDSLTRSYSRTQSQSLSLPGTATIGHAHSYSMQSSFGSIGHGGQQSSLTHDSPVDINHDIKAAGPANVGNGVATGISTALGVGLGIALAPSNTPSVEKGPPPRLILSPNSGALKESAAKTATIAVNGEDEDRGHMSDGEIPLNAASMRRRIFGRSHDSAASITNSSPLSKGSPLSSPTARDILEKEGKENGIARDFNEKEDKDSSTAAVRRVRLKKSGDGKQSDRLSIFATLSGKHRKPPPIDNALPEKASKFSLQRLHSSSIRKSSSSASNRPSTSSGSPQKSPDDFGTYDETTDFGALWKPINSNPDIEAANVNATAKEGVSILEQIGEPDHTGWMRKKADRYNNWRARYFVLKGPHLYFLRSSNKTESQIKGYIHIVGYKVTVDENIDPGRYGFRIDHDQNKTHYFSSEEKNVIRDWMKAIMKATILRDYAKPVVSSCNIPTIPLVVAQAMNPAPRPPSPSAREATQRALRRENTEQLSTRDTHVLMGLNVVDDAKDERARLDSFFGKEAVSEANSPASPARASEPAPPRPSKQVGRVNSTIRMSPRDDFSLIQWANTHLPESLQITDSTGFLCSGLGLLRIAESIRGRPSSPPVPDSAFPDGIHDDKLDGLFRLFDFLLDNDVKMGSVSINDVRLGKRDKIVQLLKALKSWEDKRKVLELNMKAATLPAAFMGL